MPPSQDPYYLLRSEIQDEVNSLKQKLAKFHGLPSNNPERKSIAQTVDAGCDSVLWQIVALGEAVTKAAVEPEKFNLTVEEVASRQNWLESMKTQVQGFKQTIKTATAPPPPDRFTASNDRFISSEQERQQLIVQNQDKDLDEIGVAVDRIHRVAGTINQELDEHDVMLGSLNEDMDTLHSRIKQASKKMQDIIRRSGNKWQFILIGVLIAILIILAVFVFY